MKYWFFNGTDVVGPFTPRELAAEKAFNENSLVCPEAFSDEEDHWQPALSFEDFQPFLSSAGQVPPSLTLEQEMDSLLHEKSPLSFEKTNTDNVALQLPKKPAKPGPIEEYFNHIEKEDLGEILGIPDPAENSDMDLAHALEHQLAKTASTRRNKQELIAADEQTVQQLEAETELPQAQQTHHVATATEVFATKAPLITGTEPELTEQEPKTELPLLPANDFQGMPTGDTAPVPQQGAVSSPALTFSHDFSQSASVSPEPAPVPPAAEEHMPEEPTTAAEIPAEPAAKQVSPEDVAVLRAEQIEVNNINARLKQTQEMEDFLQTQTTQPVNAAARKRRPFIFLVALGAILGTLIVLHQLQAKPAPAQPQPQPSAISTVEELLPQEQAAPLPPAEPPAEPPVLDQREQALQIVQNHPLSGKRGTLATYLNRIYQTQLAQGYTAAWEAQLLHKNTYIVKYRLTKPRKEPIIYVFQADIAKGKLTGALNNISLDLVGKI